MTSKVSSENVSPMKIIGDDLNYHLVYIYSSEYAHRLINVGNRYYQYDANGNIVREKDGKFDEETVQYGQVINQETENVYSTDYGWGLYNDETSKTYEVQTYDRTYKWNSRNQLISSIDANNQVAYVYGQDGQRTNKYTTSSETVYFNKMWTLHTDSGNSLYGGQYAKNIYLGDTRIVTKLNSGKDPTYQEESQKQYYYHSDHLGSASLISDYNGKEYQRIEYTPYGETWVEKTSNTGNEFLPYKFTGKEIDEETGLYYYGARYLDPKYSLWISADPALGDYIPGVGKATANDIGKLPGMGGAFNHINFNLYHYAGNNPVKYTDPTGMDIDDWQNNGDGTWTIISEGAKLWDVWGENWDVCSGVTSEEDAKKIKVGQTFGFKIDKNSSSSPILEDLARELLERERTSTIDIPITTSEYVKQGVIGAGEMILGILGYVGVTLYGAAAETAAIEQQKQIDPSIGYSMMTGYSGCTVLVADGFGLFVGAFQKSQQDSIFWKVFSNLITDPMVDVGKGLSKTLNK